MVDKITLRRSQLEKIAGGDRDAIRALEKLFEQATKLTPDDIISLNEDVLENALSAGAAGAQGEIAQGQAINLESKVDQLSLNASQAPSRESTTQIDYADFDRFSSHIDKEGRVHWDETSKTLNLGHFHGVVQQVGQETYVRVENNTGSTLTNGTVVGYVGAGADSSLDVEEYIADSSANSLDVLGVMTHDLPDNGDVGFCTTFGIVRELDTSSFSAGDVLYASPTTAGELTNVKPSPPDDVIALGFVVVSDATEGEIFVRPLPVIQTYYGTFSKTSDQSPVAINTAYAVEFDNVEDAHGVTLEGTPSTELTVPASGSYKFDVIIQLTSGSASSKDVWLWFRKNGTDIANSSHIVTMSSNNSYTPRAYSRTFTLAENDYIEVMFAADDTNVTIDNVGSTAFAPASPSAVVTVNQVH